MDTLKQHSIRRKSKVLGIRRQTYHNRKRGNRPEEKDQQIAQQLHQTVNRFVAWGFWLVFHLLRSQGMKWNHKKVYRIWKQEQLPLAQVFRNPKIFKINRKYCTIAGFSLMTESHYRRVYRHKSMHEGIKEVQIQNWH